MRWHRRPRSRRPARRGRRSRRARPWTGWTASPRRSARGRGGAGRPLRRGRGCGRGALLELRAGVAQPARPARSSRTPAMISSSTVGMRHRLTAGPVQARCQGRSADRAGRSAATPNGEPGPPTRRRARGQVPRPSAGRRPRARRPATRHRRWPPGHARSSTAYGVGGQAARRRAREQVVGRPQAAAGRARVARSGAGRGSSPRRRCTCGSRSSSAAAERRAPRAASHAAACAASGTGDAVTACRAPASADAGGFSVCLGLRDVLGAVAGHAENLAGDGAERRR